MSLASGAGIEPAREVNVGPLRKLHSFPLGGLFCGGRFGPVSDFDSKSVAPPRVGPSGPKAAKNIGLASWSGHLVARGVLGGPPRESHAFLLAAYSASRSSPKASRTSGADRASVKFRVAHCPQAWPVVLLVSASRKKYESRILACR